MKTTIIFIRHGNSVANKKGILAGTYDKGLTLKGKSQAKQVAKALKDTDIDFVYASGLPRTIKTASYLAKAKKLPIHNEPRFSEFHFGDYEGASYKKTLEAGDPYLQTYVNDFINAAFPGGETVRELIARFHQATLDLAKKHSGKTIAVATHAVALGSFIAYVKEGDMEDLKKRILPANASLTTVTVDENGKIEILSYNETAHLDHISH